MSTFNISGWRYIWRHLHNITHPAALDFLREDESRQNLNELLSQIDVQFDELTIEANSPFASNTLNAIEAKGRGAFIVVAVRKPDGTIITSPSHDFMLHEGDVIILLGHKGDIPKFARRYAMRREIRYRGSNL
jgi:K+ transport systems, NAD-binding component